MFAIVGAGPCGLTLAWLLSQQGKSCVVFDREEAVGGCHRVLRVDDRFTEHSPRVYSSSYLNVMTLLREMQIPDPFVSYQFGIPSLLLESLKRLSPIEVLWLIVAFLLFFLNPNFGKRTSVAEWCCGFSSGAQDFLDRLCRFTDGAGSDRFSIYKLLQLVNQNFFYKLLQLRETSDTGLFSQIRQRLESTGRVQFRLSTTVDAIAPHSLVAGGEMLLFEKVLLCIPPQAALPLLGQSLDSVVQSSTYDTYISATFHYNSAVEFSARWGFPQSEWGLISIPTSKYTSQLGSASVISVTCMFLHRVSLVTGKTLSQTESREEVLSEMFRQLKEVYPELPPPDESLLSPTVYFDGGSGWRERDSAYIQTVEQVGSSDVTTIPGVYHIGTHNLRSRFAYTTMESAVENAIEWFNRNEGGTRVIHHPVPLRRVMWLAVILLLLWMLVKTKSRREG